MSGAPLLTIVGVAAIACQQRTAVAGGGGAVLAGAVLQAHSAQVLAPLRVSDECTRQAQGKGEVA